MPSFTLSQLRDSVRDLGDYRNSSVFTDVLLTEFINEAIAELFELVTGQFEGYYDTSTTVTTTAGVQTVDLPADLYILRALDRELDAERHAPLSRIGYGDTYRYQGRGSPRAYMLWGGSTSSQPGTARLFPVPDAVYTLRVTYQPLFTPLSADGDTFDFRNGWQEMVFQAALLRCDQREERPLNDRLALIERAKERIISSAGKRNSAEPEHLTDWSRTPWPGEGWL